MFVAIITSYYVTCVKVFVIRVPTFFVLQLFVSYNLFILLKWYSGAREIFHLNFCFLNGRNKTLYVISKEILILYDAVHLLTIP